MAPLMINIRNNAGPITCRLYEQYVQVFWRGFVDQLMQRAREESYLNAIPVVLN